MAVGAATRRTRAPTACDDVAPARGSRTRRRCPDPDDPDRIRSGTGCSSPPAGVRSCFRASPGTALSRSRRRYAAKASSTASSSSSGGAGCCSMLDSTRIHRARRSTGRSSLRSLDAVHGGKEGSLILRDQLSSRHASIIGFFVDDLSGRVPGIKWTRSRFRLLLGSIERGRLLTRLRIEIRCTVVR